MYQLIKLYYILISLGCLLLYVNTSTAQLNITSTSVNYVIDFDNTVNDVNNGTFDGSGFLSTTSSGDLDANAWAITGLSDGNKGFGDENTTGDYARGTSTGAVGMGGFYAFDISNGGTVDRALGIQPIDADFTPGTITLQITNNTGGILSSLNISYDIYIYNNEDKSNSFNFSYSSDNSTYIPVNALDFTSTAAADASPSWTLINKSTSVSGLSIANGGSFYLRWTGDEVSGTSSSDELALDNISINACAPAATTASNFSTSSVVANSMDISFTRGDGTGGVLVLAKAGSEVNANPISGSSYAANATFGSGDEIGDGNFVIYNGIANGTNASTGNISISGLSAVTTYHFAVFEYNTSGTCYNLSALTGNTTTDCSTPPDATNLEINTDNAQVDITWIAPTCGDEVIVVAKSGASISATPSGNGASYAADANFGNGTDIGTDEFIVYKGNGTSVTVTGLTNETTYYFKIFTRNNTTWSTGAENRETPTSNLFYISEWLIDPNGTDNPYEYIEVRGNASTALTDVYLLLLECDDVSTKGQIHEIIDLSSISTGTNGYVAIVDVNDHPYSINANATTFDAGDFDTENGSVTLLLVKAPTTTPTMGTDLDEDDDPTNGFGNFPTDWTLYDAIARLDGGKNDQGYAKIIYSADGDGVGLHGSTIINLGATLTEVQYMMRKGTTTGNTSSDWVAMKLDNPSANFTVETSSDADYDVGQVITNHLGTDNPTSLLPVELLHFSGTIVENQVLLSWKTATELDNDYFIIERSDNQFDFEAIGNIKGAGTTFETQSYRFFDKNPTTGTIYYRLKQVDFDGLFDYSPLIAVHFEKAENIKAFPNPTLGLLTVELPNAWSNRTTIQIFDLMGRVVKEQILTDTIGNFNLSDLPNGHYILKATNNSRSITQRFSKM